MKSKFSCPRRNEVFGNWRPADGDEELPDEWRPPRGEGQPMGAYSTCSYCGSADPDELMEAIENRKVVLGPTDKSYKLYLDKINEDGSRDGYAGKFYTPHFSVEQGDRFKELYLEGKLVLGYPGHFYAKLSIPMSKKPSDG